MKMEVILVIVLGIGALLIVAANDLWKQRLVEKAESDGRQARKDLYTNRTQWWLVAVLASALAIYAYLLAHPDLTNGDFGPLTPLARWLFSKRP